MAGAAWYRQNTVNVTQGSATVVGVSTMFTTQVSVGDIFTVDDEKIYEVSAVTDNTHLTLRKPYTGATASATDYSIIRNFTTTTNASLAAQLTALLTSWQGREDQTRTWLNGSKLDGYRINGTPATPAGNDPLAGYYPMSDAVGVTRYVPCPQRLADADTVDGFQTSQIGAASCLIVTDSTGRAILGSATAVANSKTHIPMGYAYTGGEAGVTLGMKVINYGAGGLVIGGGASTQTIWFSLGDSNFTAANNTAPTTVSVGIDSASIWPGADNAITNGLASKRWSTIYAATGTINTSDAREKTAVAPLTADEIAAAKDLAKEIGSYQFLSSIAEKGEQARHHIGMTVQRAMEVMQAHNLDPLRYGFICYDEWPDAFIDHPAETNEQGSVTKEAWREQVQTAGNRYSFRPDELLFFIARGFEARLVALEG